MKLDLPEQKKLVHEIVIPIRWGDMDAMGHLNNASYFRFLETARTDWFHRVGCMPNLNGESPVLVNAFCSFFKPLAFPGNVLVKLYVSDVGRSSYESWGTLELENKPGVIYASGGGTTVWVDIPKGTAAPLPQWMLAHLI